MPGRHGPVGAQLASEGQPGIQKGQWTVGRREQVVAPHHRRADHRQVTVRAGHETCRPGDTDLARDWGLGSPMGTGSHPESDVAGQDHASCLACSVVHLYQ